MIFLSKKNFNNPPNALTRAAACIQIRSATLAKNGDLYSSYHYAAQSVVDLLRAYSIQEDYIAANELAKCNYCESKLEHGVTLQVEHYRPKAKVDAKDNNNVGHPGYYWLGLEWSNLLLSCPKCNAKGAKGNRFPIRGPRAVPVHPVDGQGTLSRLDCFADKQPLLVEDALLLNPEIDNPENFLTFNANGYISSHGQDTLRGDTSIEIYRLNRDALVAARIDVLNKFMKRINIDIAARMIGMIGDETLSYNFKAIIREMLERKSPKEEFTLWANHFNDEVETCVISFLPTPYDIMFRRAYAEVIAE